MVCTKTIGFAIVIVVILVAAVVGFILWKKKDNVFESPESNCHGSQWAEDAVAEIMQKQEG